MRAKYVMTEKGPILFPDSFRHSDFQNFNPMSAGFASIDDEGVYAGGNSTSLRLKSAIGDAEMIMRAFEIGD